MPQQSVAYAIARTRAMEAKLLTTEKLRRMLDMPTAGQVLRALAESGYGHGEQEDYEAMIRSELAGAADYVKEVTPNQAATDVLLYPNDCHNLKTLLKARMLGKDAGGMLLNTGSISPEELEKAVESAEYRRLPKHMGEAFGRLATNLESGSVSPQEVDCRLDAACYLDMADAAKRSGEAVVMDYVTAQADLTNLRTFLRAKQTQHPQEILKNALVPGGSADREAFFNAVGMSDDGLIQYLGLSKYDDVIAEGWTHYQKTGSASMLERDCDDFITQMLLRHKYEALSVLPLLGYWIAKQREAQAVRLVMVAKTNDVPLEMAQERLRGLYE